MENYEMDDLLPLVAKLAEKYTSGESSSITYEKANQLMEAVLYCINETEKTPKKELLINKEDKKKAACNAYERGYQIVCQKVRTANQLYIELLDSFDSYGSTCYEETIRKGMPVFFQTYDVRFAPQETILTLDYPTICPVYELQGIDAIEKYLIYISVEQFFLSKLPRQFVIDLLIAYEPGYEELFDNIVRVVYRAMIGHLLANKPISEQGYSKEEYENLELLIVMRTKEELKEQIQLLLTLLVERHYENNQKLLQYLEKDLDDFVVELINAADHNVLNAVFPL